MKKRIVIFVFIIGMLSLSNHVFGQLSASYQYSSLNKIGLGYNFSNKVWTELRIYSNTFLNDFTPEIALFYNVSMKARHEIYVGIGGTINYFNGVVVPIGLQFRPIDNFKRFSIQIEFEPIIDFDRQDIIFQSSAGIRYTFGKD
jgi:hypothetical protein